VSQGRAPIDERGWEALPPVEARSVARSLPLTTRFRLGPHITPVQFAFLQQHGFCVFDAVASEAEVAQALRELERVEQWLLAEGVEQVHGVPVWFGEGPDGEPMLQRMGFASVHSDWLEAFVTDARFEPVRRLIGDDARIGTREKDGVVFNRYLNSGGSLRPGVPWHTDALRDVFYNRTMPGPMLNVGLHFDRIRPSDGGLRVLPGTHQQGSLSTLFRKVHFVTDDDDPDEVMVETWPGDLTVHDGRMWHRVKASPHLGPRSLRRSLYVPYVVDAYAPKSPDAKTNTYMRLFDRVMKVRRRLRTGRRPRRSTPRSARG
jgi:hypothetical protein